VGKEGGRGGEEGEGSREDIDELEMAAEELLEAGR